MHTTHSKFKCLRACTSCCQYKKVPRWYPEIVSINGFFRKKTQRPLTLGSDKAWIEKIREMKEVLLYNEEINRSIMKKVNFEHEDFMVFNFRPFATVLAFQLYVAKTRCICYFYTMEASISHDRKDETPEEKARWFQSLPLSERMEMLCSFTDLALTVNPKLQDRRHAQQTSGRIQVISAV